LLWVGVNFSVPGICAGCPYRGGYCPGVCQLYFAPFLSAVMYKGKERGSGARSFKVNLALEGNMEYRLSIKRILVDGTILSVLLSILIYGSLYVDPLMWVDDYPPDIQTAVGTVQVPLGRIIIVSVLSLGIIIGVVLRSNARLRRQNDGKLSYLTAFINSALILFFFAAWDLLILDWLIFVTIQPDFIVIPGTEGLAGYKDYWFHFKVSFLGWAQWISILVGGLILAGLSMIRLGGRQRSEA
jgi:hypothetical protein